MTSLEPTATAGAHAQDWQGVSRRRTPRAVARASARLALEAPLVLIVTCMLVLWSTQGAHQLAADTWLNLLGGREILAHGLPYHDTLAIISRG